MTNKELFCIEMKELCKTCGIAIEQIAKDCEVEQDMVAVVFIETFINILEGGAK